jgi:hypothetical protein
VIGHKATRHEAIRTGLHGAAHQVSRVAAKALEFIAAIAVAPQHEWGALDVLSHAPG